MANCIEQEKIEKRTKFFETSKNFLQSNLKKNEDLKVFNTFFPDTNTALTLPYDFSADIVHLFETEYMKEVHRHKDPNEDFSYEIPETLPWECALHHLYTEYIIDETRTLKKMEQLTNMWKWIC